MSKLRYNERSWAIDIISEINLFCANTNKPIKSASGELTVSEKTMFPDVILFGEKNIASYIQGWELKFPDTKITDKNFIENAVKKARLLKLNSFLLWNVTTAVLYVLNEKNEFCVFKTWNDLSKITKREQVQANKEDWKKLLFKIIKDLNNFFDEGKIISRTLIDSFSENGLIDFIIDATPELEKILKNQCTRNSDFEAQIYLWWKNCKTEYQELDNEWAALSKLILISWINKIIFTHILRKYYKSANKIIKFSSNKKSIDMINFFKELSSECDFLNIFKPQLGESLVSKNIWDYFLELNLFLSKYEMATINQDFLKEILEKTVLSSKRKVFGQYTTPLKLAELLSRLTISDKKGFFYDGCCGTGTIVRSVYNLKREYGLSVDETLNSIWGSDKFTFPIQLSTISISAHENMGKIINIFNQDILELKSNKEIEFQDPTTAKIVKKKFPQIDYFISNLPFIRQEDIETLYKKKININEYFNKTTNTKINLSGKSDFYVFIIFHLLNLISSKGTIGVIISNSWLATSFGNDFRDLLIKFFNIKYVVTSGKGRWFQNAQVVTNLLILEKKDLNKKEPSNKKISFVVLEEEIDKIEDIKDLSLNIISGKKNKYFNIKKYSEEEIKITNSIGLGWSSLFSDLNWIYKIKEKLISANSLFEINRGERRGWDEMFYPGNIENIESEYLKPILKSSSKIDSLIANPDTYAFCCSRSLKDLSDLKHSGAINWIKKFENMTNKSGKPLTEVLKQGKNFWYEFKPKAYADLITSISPDERIFIAKLSKSSLVNQRLISFKLMKDENDLDLIHALLNSMLSVFLLEALGFGRGLGVLDLNATNLKNKFKVLNPELLNNEDKKQIKNLFNSILKREIKPLLEEIEMPDRIKFEEQVLKSFSISNIKEDLKNSLIKMHQIRKSVNK